MNELYAYLRIQIDDFEIKSCLISIKCLFFVAYQIAYVRSTIDTLGKMFNFIFSNLNVIPDYDIICIAATSLMACGGSAKL